MTGLSGLGWYKGLDACVEIACNSGVLEMMADARLISVAFGGAEDDLSGGVTRCAS